MVTGSALTGLQCRVVVETEKRCVAIHEFAVAGFDDGIDERKKARLIRIMELWCDGHRLTEEQFNGNEGREQKGELNVLIQAFKTHKVRLYGFEAEIHGRRTFLIVDIDPSKKQNRADPKVLKRVKQKSISLLVEINMAATSTKPSGRTR